MSAGDGTWSAKLGWPLRIVVRDYQLEMAAVMAEPDGDSFDRSVLTPRGEDCWCGGVEQRLNAAEI